MIETAVDEGRRYKPNAYGVQNEMRMRADEYSAQQPIRSKP